MHFFQLSAKLCKIVHFETENYANNCKKIYDIGTIYNHHKIVNGKVMSREQKDKKDKTLCKLFLGTPSSKLLNDLKRTMIDKYAEALSTHYQK